MKHLLLLLLFPLISFGQNYSKGYEAGYKKGYCIDYINCLRPNVIAPSPEIWKDTYNDGYSRGVVEGSKAVQGDGNSSMQGRKGVNDLLNYDQIAKASGGNSTAISNEQAQQLNAAGAEVGEAIDLLIIAKKIKNAKKRLRNLPSQYIDFPNLYSAFLIGEAVQTIITLDVKPKTSAEYDIARKKIKDRYKLSADLFDSETLATYDLYEGDWGDFSKENKAVAKQEIKNLKEYLKSKKEEEKRLKKEEKKWKKANRKN